MDADILPKQEIWFIAVIIIILIVIMKIIRNTIFPNAGNISITIIKIIGARSIIVTVSIILVTDLTCFVTISIIIIFIIIGIIIRVISGS